MRKQASFSSSLSLPFSLSFSLPPACPPTPLISHPLYSPYKSFSSGNSTAREMKFMNSNAARTFLLLVKGRKRIRETLNSVTSAGSMGRAANYFSRAKQRVKFVTEDRRYYYYSESNSALTYLASSFEMKYPISGTFDPSSNGHLDFVDGLR